MSAACPGPTRPEVEVGDLVAVDFQLGPDTRGKLRIDDSVQENGAGVSQKAQRPVSDHERADDAHHWIHPGPAEERPVRSAPMASTEVMASASTCRYAARRLWS